MRIVCAILLLFMVWCVQVKERFSHPISSARQHNYHFIWRTVCVRTPDRAHGIVWDPGLCPRSLEDWIGPITLCMYGMRRVLCFRLAMKRATGEKPVTFQKPPVTCINHG